MYCTNYSTCTAAYEIGLDVTGQSSKEFLSLIVRVKEFASRIDSDSIVSADLNFMYIYLSCNLQYSTI